MCSIPRKGRNFLFATTRIPTYPFKISLHIALLEGLVKTRRKFRFRSSGEA
jgi:hypothetical protein